MRNLAIAYAPNKVFWDEYPQFTLTEPFASFYKNDKSRKKSKSSSVMWAISILEHPKSDLYYVADKYKQVSSTMFGDEDFDWEKYSEQIDAFNNTVLTQAEQSLKEWESRLKQRDEFLSKQEYCFDHYNEEHVLIRGNAEQLDKMAANTSKLYAQLFDIKKMIEEEEKKEAAKRGSRMESLSDSGKI